MNKNYNCTIIISSCDKYSDAWAPFFTLFFRYWPDCPFRLILISNGLEYNDPRVTTFKITNDLGWSGNLIEVLKNIDEDYVIYFQEDYFLQKTAATDKVVEALNLMKNLKAGYFRLYPCPKPNLPFAANTEIGIISQDANYRNSTQASIWDKQTLLSLLNPAETGWDFETRGGLERAKANKSLFLSYQKPVVDYLCTAIVKGRYIGAAIKLCQKEGIDLKMDRIKPQSMRQIFKYEIKKWINFFQKT
jgi:hypothetical protein